VIVDYHDHHKHGFYLVLNGGMPGFTHRELVMIALVIRAHRKSLPSYEWLRPVLEKGDDARFLRLASCLRLAEQLERDRTQQVTSVAVERVDDTVQLRLNGDADHSVAVWSAAPEAEVFRQAFGASLDLIAEHAELVARPDDAGGSNPAG
jgi:exopolyphosphatase/guanosine-5'-triphosphate,3'-diphosphate pyrophosphatase